MLDPSHWNVPLACMTWSKQEAASPGWPTRTWGKHWSLNRYTVQNLNTSLIVSFSHIIHTTCSPFFLGWWTTRDRQSGAWWKTRSGHRWFILYFYIPDEVSSSGSVTWIAKMDEGVSSSLPDRRELELFQVLTASSRHCGPPAAFESFDWMLV